MHIPFTLNTDLQTGICFAGKVSVKIYFVLINKPLQQMTSSQRSCQYSCSIPDCVLPTALCTHVLYQGPDQCTQTVQYRPCMTSFQLFWKLCRNRLMDQQTNRPTDRRTDQLTYLSLDAFLPKHNNWFLGRGATSITRSVFPAVRPAGCPSRLKSELGLAFQGPMRKDLKELSKK